jgi:hypothetical protein
MKTKHCVGQIKTRFVILLCISIALVGNIQARPSAEDLEKSHFFTVKCQDATSPSGSSDPAGNAPAVVAPTDPFDDRTPLGQSMIQQLEAQGGVVWRLYTKCTGAGWSGYEYFKTHEKALKALAHARDDNWIWQGTKAFVEDAWVDCVYDCGCGANSDAPWLKSLITLNPNAPSDLKDLAVDALYHPPLMWYFNQLNGIASTFIARQGGGIIGDSLFRTATGNFYPDSGTPGGVIGEYAALYAYNFEMARRLRQLLQAMVDNQIAGINVTLDQILEGSRFCEQLEATHMQYLMPSSRSFMGSYPGTASSAIINTVGTNLFKELEPGLYLFFPPIDGAENANVNVSTNSNGFTVTAT